MSRLVPVYWAFVAALVGVGVWQISRWSPNAAVAAALVAGLGVQMVSAQRERENAERERKAQSAGYTTAMRERVDR